MIDNLAFYFVCSLYSAFSPGYQLLHLHVNKCIQFIINNHLLIEHIYRAQQIGRKDKTRNQEVSQSVSQSVLRRQSQNRNENETNPISRVYSNKEQEKKNLYGERKEKRVIYTRSSLLINRLAPKPSHDFLYPLFLGADLLLCLPSRVSATINLHCIGISTSLRL